MPDSSPESKQPTSLDCQAALDAICTHPPQSRISTGHPHTQPLHLSVVWECVGPQQADELLATPGSGYVYRRDGHPNATSLADQLGQLHGAERTILTAQGMSALGLAFLGQLNPGDHLVLSRQLYGKTLQLAGNELQRWGITSQQVDVQDMPAIREACRHPKFRMLVAETIANPCLEVADVRQLADIVHQQNGVLMIDNTFATPLLCRPLELGADLVMESLSKFVCGHGDVMLGLLCGTESSWKNMTSLCSMFGMASSPLDCWLTQRGLTTLPLRLTQACQNALRLAEFLSTHSSIELVHYPGLAKHPQHELAKTEFRAGFGHVLSFRPHGGKTAAYSLLERLSGTIPFCPSLGECQTTFSHPASTSHRGLSSAAKQLLGIDDGLLRLSCGIEPTDWLVAQVATGLNA
jgi:cystathionine beta-lyase/cystathionine gamma-synthase